MNCIIIAGHPQSGYQEVEHLLNSSGMKAAKPSRREGFLPFDIGAALSKAYNLPSISDIASENDIPQIDVAPVWHVMALDLLLGNIEQDLWGWADSQSIYLLDYWKTIDPKFTFILVYDEPHRALFESALDDFDPITPESLEHRIDNWVAYNGALLRFYMRNQERCLLVNVKQVLRDAGGFLKKLHTLLDETQLELDRSPIKLPVSVNNDIDTYLIDSIIAEHPQSQQCFEELQSLANEPIEVTATHSANPTDAWLKLVHQRSQARQQLNQLIESRSQVELQLQQRNNELDALQSQLSLVKEQSGRGREMKELSQENELLLVQLHQVQEELERYYLDNQRLRQKRTSAYYGAADRVKRQLSYRLGAIMIKHSHSISGWIRMPFVLVQEMRAFRQEKAINPATKLPPIHTYLDAHEAEKVKRHLSYRLGSVMVQHAASPIGWIKMPFLFQREVKEFRQQRNGK